MKTKTLTSRICENYEISVKINYFENEIILNDSVIMNKDLINQFIEEMQKTSSDNFTANKNILK